MLNKRLPIIETIGIEYEFSAVPLEAMQGVVPNGWNVVRDGSCTRNELLFTNQRVEGVGDSLAMYAHRGQVGGEVVSPPFNLETQKAEYTEQLITIIGALSARHETVSDLTGIHIHVNVGEPPAYMVKNLLRLWTALEAVLYRLAVAEHSIHRGATHNDYMYCRPLTPPGPQIVRDDAGAHRHCFDLDKILENAKTTAEIVKAFGRGDHKPSKWMPFRYYGLNIATIHIFGTVEFRLFNQTLVPEFVGAWVELCRALVKLSFMDRPVSQLPQFPLGATTPEGRARFNFDTLRDYIPESLITPPCWSMLKRLFHMADWQKGVEPQVNHLVRTRGRTVPLDTLPRNLRPEVLASSYVERHWDKGYEEG